MVEDLKKVGEELVENLDEFGADHKAREIEEDLYDYQNRYGVLQDGITEKQNRLVNVLVESQDVHNTIDTLLNWINETEDIFDNMAPVSLDKNILNQQIQAHRVLHADITSHQGNIDATVDQASGVEDAQYELQELVDRYDALNSRSRSRANELEESASKLSNLHNSLVNLEQWVSNAINSVKTGAKTKGKFEDLYRQKLNKQTEFTSLKKAGKAFIDDPNTGDIRIS